MSNVCVLCVKPLIKYLRSRISLHVFPTCPKKRQIWLNQCRLTNEEVLPNRKICSFHFESTCFKSNAKRRILHADAVPTIFVNSHVKKIVKGGPKNFNKKGIVGENRQSQDIPLTRAAKKKISSRNYVSHDILPKNPATEVHDRVKSIATNRKRKLELDKPITELKKNKLSYMSLLKLVNIQSHWLTAIK
ncbi:THAP domain-containing protein 2-like [Acyrthosiphon pisum]|uniref:THAP-type domain-containing protein n=1 Tax=Acyrthosiphon pisum TaxID=7029 RepID=A0A8R2D5Q6_ACYPI|nr:THAP domain-containing protein 2-like [Acyrthosiphon pisum]|eukprot:XP_016662670.1 PREDICTED: THAP domain-containing protein 2-like [Acyrthosiphon pisum]